MRWIKKTEVVNGAFGCPLNIIFFMHTCVCVCQEAADWPQVFWASSDSSDVGENFWFPSASSPSARQIGGLKEQEVRQDRSAVVIKADYTADSPIIPSSDTFIN